MKRKTPVRHKVRSHTREGKPVKNYQRGKGSNSTTVRKRVVVGQSSVKVPGWLIEETDYVLGGVDPKDIMLLRTVDGMPIFTGVDPSGLLDIQLFNHLCNGVVDKSFTSDELSALRCIGIFSFDSLRDELGEGVVGLLHDNLPDGVMVMIDASDATPGTIIHELIHALREVKGAHLTDVDTDEKQTELETIARLQHVYGVPGWQEPAGYYKWLPKVTQIYSESEDVDLTEQDEAVQDEMVQNEIRKAIKHDRVLLTGSMGKNLVGDAAFTQTIQKYPESMIATVHFSPPERMDRYFVVQRPGMREADVHLRFDDPPDESKVMSGLTKLYGSDAEIWEWKDGVKVKIR